MRIRRGYVEIGDGRQIHYRAMGEGPAVVLLHKTPSSSIQFVRALPILARHHRVLALDTPGFGLSDPPLTQPTMGDYADTLLDTLDVLGVERATLVGHHTGAHIAIEATVKAPDRVASLILSGVFAITDEAQRPEWKTYFEQFRFELDAHGAFLERFPLPMLERDFTYSPEDPERYLMELIAYLQGGPDFWWAYHAMIEQPVYELLAQVERPMFMLNQRHGRVVDETRAAHAAFPHATYLELEGGTEVPMDDPEAWAGALLAFVERQP